MIDRVTPEQTAQSIVAGLQDAVDTRDADAMAARFAPGAVLVGTAGYSAGDAAVRRYLEGVATITVLHWHLARYDVFLSTPEVLGFAAEGEIEWRDDDDGGTDPFRLTIVAVPDGQDWRIQHFHGSLRSE